MKIQPFISIIIPVYNMEKYLRECLDSLLTQTLREIEIICVNDCSTDTSLSILKEYEMKDSRLIVIDLKQNIKQGGARNRGIEKAKASYLCFVDSDDWVAPSMCKDMYNKAIEENADMVRGGIIQYLGPDDIRREEGLEKVLALASAKERRRHYITDGGRLWGGIIKREIFVKHHLTYPEYLFYEDNAIGVLLYLYCDKIVQIEGDYYYYRCNNQSTTRSLNNYRFFDRLETSKIFLENMKTHGFYNEYKEETDYYFIKVFYINSIMGAMLSFDPPPMKHICQIVKEMQTIMPSFTRNRYFKMNLSFKLKLFYRLLSLNVPLMVYLFILIQKCKSSKDKLFNFRQ